MSDKTAIAEDSINKAFADIFTSDSALKEEFEQISEAGDSAEEMRQDIEEYLASKADTYLQDRVSKLVSSTDEEKQEWGIFWEIEDVRDLFDGICVFLLEAIKSERPVIYLVQDGNFWRTALNSLFVDFGISTDRAPLPGNMAEAFNTDMMYDIRDFLEIVDENFRPWHEFTANPYHRSTSEGINKYEKSWLQGHDKQKPLGLCIPSKPPKDEDSENMLWDVLENIGAQRPVMWVVGCLPVE